MVVREGFLEEEASGRGARQVSWKAQALKGAETGARDLKSSGWAGTQGQRGPPGVSDLEPQCCVWENASEADPGPTPGSPGTRQV